jgi:hypothetical protein
MMRYTAPMRYELWHVPSANLIDDFVTEDEALAATRAYMTPDDRGEAVDVALIVSDEAGRPTRSIEGVELAALIADRTAGRVRRTA